LDSEQVERYKILKAYLITEFSIAIIDWYKWNTICINFKYLPLDFRLYICYNINK
jgi:hypothetical protein